MSATYEPPAVANGSTCDEYELAPGVVGYAVEYEGALYVPVIHAVREGDGDVGRFLDSLSPRCRIPNVISEKLVGMLVRRGYRSTLEQDDGGHVKVWSRPAHPAPEAKP